MLFAPCVLYALLAFYLGIGRNLKLFAVLHQFDLTSRADGDNTADDGLGAYHFQRDLVSFDRLSDGQIVMPVISEQLGE